MTNENKNFWEGIGYLLLFFVIVSVIGYLESISSKTHFSPVGALIVIGMFWGINRLCKDDNHPSSPTSNNMKFDNGTECQFSSPERLRRELLNWLTSQDIDENFDIDTKTCWTAKSLYGFNRILVNKFCLKISGCYECDEDIAKKHHLFKSQYPELIIDCTALLYPVCPSKEICRFFGFSENDTWFNSIERLGIFESASLVLHRFPDDLARIFYAFPLPDVVEIIKEDSQNRFAKLTGLIQRTCKIIDAEFRHFGFTPK